MQQEEKEKWESKPQNRREETRKNKKFVLGFGEYKLDLKSKAPFLDFTRSASGTMPPRLFPVKLLQKYGQREITHPTSSTNFAKDFTCN